MNQNDPIPLFPNVPLKCLMAFSPRPTVLYNLVGKPGSEHLEQGFVLSNGILQPEKANRVDLSEGSIQKIISTLLSCSGILESEGQNFNIGPERLMQLKEELMDRIGKSLLCELCPLHTDEKCGPRYVLDQINNSIGIFPHPTKGVPVGPLVRPIPKNTPFSQLPLVG